jgi:MFS family permease
VSSPRRTPNFARFLVTGAILGFVVGSAAAFVGDQAPGYGEGAAVAYLGVFGAAIGTMLAGVVAVLLDRRG